MTQYIFPNFRFYDSVILYSLREIGLNIFLLRLLERLKWEHWKFLKESENLTAIGIASQSEKTKQ